MRIKNLFLSICLIAGFSVSANAETNFTISVENRFRLLQAGDEDRYFADLNQRLVCGDTKKKKLTKNSRYCAPIKLIPWSRDDGRVSPNYRTYWGVKELLFDPKFIHDPMRRIQLSVTGISSAQAVRCEWRIDGKLQSDSKCFGALAIIELGADRTANPEVVGTVHTKNNKAIPIPARREHIRDVVIATLGDSFLSGEGNPHRAFRPGRGGSEDLLATRRAEWLDIRCHRSLFSNAAIAAHRLARRVPTQSVTFLPLACSGAEVREGVLKQYLGRETNKQIAWTADGFGSVSTDLYYQGRKLPTQLSILHRALCPEGVQVTSTGCGDKQVRPDVLILSNGGNELGFGAIVRDLGKGKTESPVNIQANLEKLPEIYNDLQNAIAHLGARHIFALAYMDPTERIVGRSNGRNRYEFCDDLHATHGGKTFVPKFALLFGLGVKKEGARLAQQKVLRPLNEAIRTAAKKHGWRVLALPPDIERGHGFCNKTSAWFYTYSESLNFQGLIASDIDEDRNNAPIGDVPSGAMHPNIFGHFNMAERIYAEFGRSGLIPR